MIHESVKETLFLHSHEHKLDTDTMKIVIKIIFIPVMYVILTEGW